MTVPRLREMTEYWKSNPPLHLMVASYFGIEGNSKEPQNSESDIEAILASIPQVPHVSPK
jgi:hypothetical protein